LCAIAVSFGFTIWTSIFLARSVAATGSIVSLLPNPDVENGVMNYAPVFAFTAADGKTYTVISGLSTNPPGFVVGQTVRVIYQMSHPESAKLASFWQLWFVSIVVAGLGVFILIAGYLLLLYERRRNRRVVLTAS